MPKRVHVGCGGRLVRDPERSEMGWWRCQKCDWPVHKEPVNPLFIPLVGIWCLAPFWVIQTDWGRHFSSRWGPESTLLVVATAVLGVWQFGGILLCVVGVGLEGFGHKELADRLERTAYRSQVSFAVASILTGTIGAVAAGLFMAVFG